jgi:surface carbohydrate biosynthesis protein
MTTTAGMAIDKADNRGADYSRARPILLSPILYLPMEISSRELDSRLLLAALALDRGYEIVLGQKWLMERNIRAMRPGIYLSKTLTGRDSKFMRRAKDLGYFVAAIDEEMPGLVTTEKELRWVSEEAVRATNLLFAPGTANVKALRTKYPWAADRIHAIGNPRIDLLRPELRSIYDTEVARIRAQHGRFILVNTNLGFTNSQKGPVDIILAEQVRLGKLNMASSGDAEYVEGIKAMESANRAATLELLQKLPAAFPDLRIVLRPHPSENLEFWQSAIGNYSNVTLVREGPVAPWILASQILLHTNCTTGVEAVALEKPAICLLLTDLSVNRRYLSNRINPVAGSVNEAIEMARGVLASPGQFRYSDSMMAQFHDAMSFDDAELSAVALLNEIEKTTGRPQAGDSTHWRPTWKYRWRQADKNVRGSLMPSLDLAKVSQHLFHLRKLLDLDFEISVEPCGTKLAHLSRKGLPTSIRLRRILSDMMASGGKPSRSFAKT